MPMDSSSLWVSSAKAFHVFWGVELLSVNPSDGTNMATVPMDCPVPSDADCPVWGVVDELQAPAPAIRSAAVAHIAMMRRAVDAFFTMVLRFRGPSRGTACEHT